VENPFQAYREDTLKKKLRSKVGKLRPEQSAEARLLFPGPSKRDLKKREDERKEVSVASSVRKNGPIPR